MLPVSSSSSPSPSLWLTCRSASSQAKSHRGVWANGKRGVCVTRRATFANWMKIFGFSARRQRTHRHTHTHTCDPRCIRLKIDMFWGPATPLTCPQTVKLLQFAQPAQLIRHSRHNEKQKRTLQDIKLMGYYTYAHTHNEWPRQGTSLLARIPSLPPRQTLWIML